ncbi:zinc finger, CCHC-type, retrotransposon gag domain protein [Tanacetum coccineum]
MIPDLEEEFLTSKQGNQLVKDYTAHFVDMARFAEHLIATEERKIERYIRGLRIDIMELVSTRKLVTFWEKEEKQVKENTIRGDGAVVEKEDFSDWMSEFNGLCDPYSGDMEDS